MSQFIINRNNMQDVREMCAFFAKEHKYEIERLAWQRDVLADKACKFWLNAFNGKGGKWGKTSWEIRDWKDDTKARYNHIADAYSLAKHVVNMTESGCLISLQVDSKDIEMVINYYRTHNPVEHVVYDDDFIMF